MTKTVKVCLFALGFLAATGLNAARAAEAFLCEGGKIGIGMAYQQIPM